MPPPPVHASRRKAPGEGGKNRAIDTYPGREQHSQPLVLNLNGEALVPADGSLSALPAETGV